MNSIRFLPKEIEPPRDLWPGIAARIAQEPRQEMAPTRSFRWPAALAAGFLVAAVSALLTWSLVRQPEPVVQASAPQPVETAIVPVNYGSRSGLTAAELAVRDDLVARAREKFGELRPETREAIVKNLAIIQQAADEIDAALAQDPASGMLNGMVVGTYKQELQLYTTVVTAGGGLTRRT
jgi:hypothetical protein